MSYYYSRNLGEVDFDQTIDRLAGTLKNEGFGILTQIDIKDTLKKKIDVDFKRYQILGACNPQFAYKALTAEDKIGVFLPCNVLVEENEDATIEVTAVDPVASMQSVGNENLEEIAGEVRDKLKRALDALG